MSSEKIMSIKQLLNMKEGETASLIDVFYTKEDNNIHFKVEVYPESMMFVAPYMDRYMSLLMESIKVVDVEKVISSKVEETLYAKLQVFMNENGVTVGSYFAFINPEDLKEKGYFFYEELESLLEEMANYLNNLTNQYAEMEDNNEIYSKREFEFHYKKTQEGWTYDGFARLTDRPISQQKQEIKNLIDNGVDKQLIEIVRGHEIDEYDILVIKFYSDGLSIIDYQVGGFVR